MYHFLLQHIIENLRDNVIMYFLMVRILVYLFIFARLESELSRILMSGSSLEVAPELEHLLGLKLSSDLKWN